MTIAPQKLSTGFCYGVAAAVPRAPWGGPTGVGRATGRAGWRRLEPTATPEARAAVRPTGRASVRRAENMVVGGKRRRQRAIANQHLLLLRPSTAPAFDLGISDSWCSCKKGRAQVRAGCRVMCRVIFATRQLWRRPKSKSKSLLHNVLSIAVLGSIDPGMVSKSLY